MHGPLANTHMVGDFEPGRELWVANRIRFFFASALESLPMETKLHVFVCQMALPRWRYLPASTNVA